MKKLLSTILAFVLAAALLAGCGGKPSSSSTPADTGAASKPAVKTGLIEYDPDELLESFSDYIDDQDMAETDAVSATVDMEKGDFTTMTYLNFALLDANNCIKTAMFDEFNGSGKTLDGAPVTKATSGDVTTWVVEKIADADMRPYTLKGDVTKANISLNTATNTLVSEVVVTRGADVINKTVNKVVALADGTVLSEFYAAGPNAQGNATETKARLFKYNLAAGEFECIAGTFKNEELNFTAPACLTADDIDRDTFLSFINMVGTVKVADGTGEVTLP